MRKAVFVSILAAIAVAVILFAAAPPSLQLNLWTTNTFGINTTQLQTNGGTVSIKSGAPITNFYAANTFTANYAEFTNNVQIDGSLVLPQNATNNFILTSDGSGTATWKPPALSVNGTNGGTTPNVADSATVTWAKSGSNITGTAISAVSVNGTNTTTPNIQDSATVTWAKSGSNLVASATASGGGVSINGTNISGTANFQDSPTVTFSIASATNVVPITKAKTWVTLGLSGTNVTGFNPGEGTNYFKLTLTGTAFVPAPTTLPTTSTPLDVQIVVQEDSTGTYALTWATNYVWPNKVAPVQTTNAGAMDLYVLTAHPFTNNMFIGSQVPYF